jgi:hypothetical protein
VSPPTWAVRSWGRHRVATNRTGRTGWIGRSIGRKAWALPAVVCVAIGIGAWIATQPPTVATSGGVSLRRTVNGLLYAQSFGSSTTIRDLNDDFSFDGSARAGVGVEKVDGRGLVVAVHHHAGGYQGWFATTTAAYPSSGVFHVQMTRPPGNVSGMGTGVSVFAIQTFKTLETGVLNYVIVSSSSTRGQTYWSIGYANGRQKNTQLHNLVNFRLSSSAPHTHNITVQTDGSHRVVVYIGNQLVFESDHLHLAITPPFQVYLEVQSVDTGYASYFHNFWVSASSTLTFQGIPGGASVSLVAGSGGVLWRQDSSGGTLRAVLPISEARGRARLIIRRDGQKVSLGPFSYTGGDHYVIAGLPTSVPAKALGVHTTGES